jgi:uncharacterized membrane protein YeaQ/YmgE (transglycosylase-associated protein family)
MLHIIWSIIVGFIIGLIARAIMPGVQHLARLFSKPEPGSSFHPAGVIMSIIGALILLFIWGKISPG